MKKIVEKIITRLEEAGFEGYIVGGAVRDILMGIIPHDYDIATNALPEQIKKVFYEAKPLGFGEKHGTVAILIENYEFQITTYRLDGVYKDNRHPERVIFEGTLERDLSRRDFTINAMALKSVSDDQVLLHQNLIDLYNGQADLKKRIIRAIGNPHQRFREDALRIMRALRFACQYNFVIEEATSQAIHDLAFLLKNIAIERIISELVKIFSYQCNLIFAEYFDVLAVIFKHLKNVDQNDFQLKQKQIVNDFICQLALIFTFYSDKLSLKPILQQYKLTNEVIKKVFFLCTEKFVLPKNKIEAKKILKNYGLEYINLYLKYHFFNNSNLYNEQIELFQTASLECYQFKCLKINGHEMLEIGISQKEIQFWKNHLLDLVIEDKLINDHQVLKKYLENNFSSKRRKKISEF